MLLWRPPDLTFSFFFRLNLCFSSSFLPSSSAAVLGAAMIQIRYRSRISLLQVQISGMSALKDGVLLLHGYVSLSSGETLTEKGILFASLRIG